MKNIAFLSTDSQTSQLLRAELFRLGLSFTSSYINSKFHFMIVSNDLTLIKKLAKSYNCGKFYISDSRRTLFEVSFIGGVYSPTKLGTLKRSLSQEGSSTNTTGAFCLVVNEDNRNYYYDVQQIVESLPQIENNT